MSTHVGSRPARRRLALGCLAAALIAAQAAPAQAQRRPARPAAAPQKFFTSPLSLEEMRGKQAVVETERGEIVIDLRPEAAPNHVGYFITQARDGAYDGTTFHRAIKHGIIQGGDPLSKDPAKRAQYGTGGLGVLQREPNDLKHVRGAVSAVLRPGQPDSAGAQFFISITDQPALDGNYTVFGYVVDGIETAQAISEASADAEGRLVERLAIRRVTIRDTPPEPFATDSDAQLAEYRVTLQTSLGPIAIELFPDRAPGHARAFLRLAEAGVYTGTTFHRVVPRFVAQAGLTSTRATPLTERQRALVRNLPPEFNDTPHDRGIVSMARLDAPDSAQTSFFIVLGPQPALDGKYTVFGRVADGMPVVDAIEQTPVDGEAPRTPIVIEQVRIERRVP